MSSFTEPNSNIVTINTTNIPNSLKPLNIIIVEKTGVLKLLSIKEFKLDEVFKKCGFKKGEDFLKQTEWSVKLEGKKYFIEVYGKTDGRANSENKYDFPPPIDTKLFFGSCAIIAYVKENNDDKDKKGKKYKKNQMMNETNKTYIDLSLETWKKIYEKLFGGFEDLSATAEEDENEIDELANVPKEKKTKQGYLKDGFVVDDDDDEEDEYEEDKEEYDDEDFSDDLEDLSNTNLKNLVNSHLEDDELGSELSEETYET